MLTRLACAQATIYTSSYPSLVECVWPPHGPSGLFEVCACQLLPSICDRWPKDLVLWTRGSINTRVPSSLSSNKPNPLCVCSRVCLYTHLILPTHSAIQIQPTENQYIERCNRWLTLSVCIDHGFSAEYFLMHVIGCLNPWHAYLLSMVNEINHLA